MPIRLSCSCCGKRWKAPDHYAGRKAKCGQCGASFLVEREESTTDPRWQLREKVAAQGADQAENWLPPAKPAEGKLVLLTRYHFAYTVLPRLLTVPDFVASLLTGDPNSHMALAWRIAEKNYAEGDAVPAIGLAGELLPFDDYQALLLVTLPAPCRVTEGYFAAAVIPTAESDGTRNPVRYFVLSHSDANKLHGGKAGCIREIVVDENGYSNHRVDDPVEPTKGDFITAVRGLCETAPSSAVVIRVPTVNAVQETQSGGLSSVRHEETAVANPGPDYLEGMKNYQQSNNEQAPCDFPGRLLSIGRATMVSVPQLVVSAMLLWALNPGNRYSYYIILRWVCCIVFGGLAVRAFVLRKHAWLLALGIAAVVYNPVFRVHLTRDIWSVVNVLAIGLALGSTYGLFAGSPAKDSER